MTKQIEFETLAEAINFSDVAEPKISGNMWHIYERGDGREGWIVEELDENGRVCTRASDEKKSADAGK